MNALELPLVQRRPTPLLYTTAEVAELADVPYDTLIHWKRLGWIRVRRSAGRRYRTASIRWTETEAARVIEIADMRRRHAREIATLTGRKPDVRSVWHRRKS